MADHDPCAVNHLIETPGCSPVKGRVVWDPVTSLWNGAMLALTLVFGAATFSLGALAVFVVTTGTTLLLGHSVGFHRRMIHGSFKCPLWLEHFLVWVGTVVGILCVEHGEDVFPLILARRPVEGREHEHEHLGAHAERKQEVAAGEVQDFEERAPDYDGRAD